MQKVLDFAEHPGCRTRHLLATSAKTSPADCGHCDACEGAAAAAARCPRRPPARSATATPRCSATSAPSGTSRSPRRARRARFLCGITSPAATREKLAKHKLFGAFAGVPFRDVLRFVERSERGAEWRTRPNRMCHHVEVGQAVSKRRHRAGTRGEPVPHPPGGCYGCVVAIIALLGLFTCCGTGIGWDLINWLGSDSATGAEAEALCRAFLAERGLEPPGTLKAARYYKGVSRPFDESTAYYRFELSPAEAAAFEAGVRRTPDPTPGITSEMDDPSWWDLDACGDHVSWSTGSGTVLLCRRTGKVYMSTWIID